MQLKKLLSVVMAVAVLTAIIPFGAFTASAETISGSCGDNVTWEYDTETATLTISGTGEIYDYYCIYSYGRVKKIETGAPWGSYCDIMKKIIIHSGVTSIGCCAFAGCTGIESIVVPNSVTSIGDYAFYGCTKLANVIIGNSVTSIGELAFSGCSGLTSITISDSVTSIGKNAFDYGVKNIIISDGSKTVNSIMVIGGSKLESVTIPNSVTSIGNEAFRGCNGLTSITIPNSVTSIGKNAFDGCTGLTSITIPDSVTSIGERAFSGCTGLASVTIGNSITSIGKQAFSGCTGLTSITIPDSVTSIGERAFSSCTRLANVIIGYGVTSINHYAFSGCTGLTNITVDSGNIVYYSTGNCIIETESKTLVAGCKNSTIPNDGNVTSIGTYAFYNCTGLTNITIPNSVTTIGNLAFYHCTGLTSVTIPDSVTSIGGSTFNDCTGLTNITIGNGVKSIDSYAFYGCTGLTSITIPDSVTSIGMWAFSGCTGLTSITIPDGVTSIGYSAFYGCTKLTSVTIGNSVTSIGDTAIPETTTVFCYVNSFTETYAKTKGLNYTLLKTCGANAEYAVINNILYIKNSGDTDNYKTQASVPWYNYTDQITEIQIDGGINKIGNYSFYCLNNLDTLIIKNKDVDFGRYVFNTENKNIKIFAESGGSVQNYCNQNGIEYMDPKPTPVLVSATSNTITIEANSGYQYSMGGKDWQTGGVFIGLSPVTDYTIYAKHLAASEHFADSPYKTLTVKTDKSTVSAPQKPICIRNTDTEIMLQANDLYEYSIDGENWQKSNVFSGLTHKNTYLLYQRVAETETEYASPASMPLTMQLVKKAVSAPTAPDYQSHTDNSITLAPNALYEFSIDGENWQKSSEFTGLSKNTIYRFYQRVAETETEYASEPSAALIIAIPDKPEILEAGYENILVKLVDGFEYCLDDFVWQDSNTFDKLIDNTEYYVYQRLKSVDGEKVYLITSEYTAVTTDNGIAHTHIFGEWSVKTEPTCTETGEEIRACADCGYIEARDVNALGHTESDWITDIEPNNQSTGEKHKECTVCGKILETGIIPKTSSPGDINGDGEVNNKDLTRLFQYLSNWEVEVNEAALDVNGDDSVDNKDLTRLFQYLSNWDVEIY